MAKGTLGFTRDVNTSIAISVSSAIAVGPDAPSSNSMARYMTGGLRDFAVGYPLETPERLTHALGLWKVGTLEDKTAEGLRVAREHTWTKAADKLRAAYSKALNND